MYALRALKTNIYIYMKICPFYKAYMLNEFYMLKFKFTFVY